MVLLAKIQCAHKLPIHFLPCAAWHRDWWRRWPEGLRFPQWFCRSLRRQCAQSQHSQTSCTSAALQATWHCGPGTSKGHWAACSLFSCHSHNHVGHEDRALQPPVHPTVSASGFLPITLNFDILAWLVPNELLGPVFDDLGLQEGS